jgi:hypothetical protein
MNYPNPDAAIVLRNLDVLALDADGLRLLKEFKEGKTPLCDVVEWLDYVGVERESADNYAPMAHLLSLVSFGKVENAREWAKEHAGELVELRYSIYWQFRIAKECNRLGVPVVWPWDSREMSASERATMQALRSGKQYFPDEIVRELLLAWGKVRVLPSGHVELIDVKATSDSSTQQ